VLFNNIYESPVMALADDETGSLLTIMNGLSAERREVSGRGRAVVS